MKKLAFVPLFMAIPAAAQAPAPTFADAIGICRIALVEQIQGGDGSKSAAIVNGLPAEQQGAVRVVCSAYFTGIADITAIQRGNPAQAKSI